MAKTTDIETLSHFMYVVECADGTLYTGYAVNVEERVRTHNLGNGAKYTRSRRPVTLVAQVEFATKHDAMRAEFMFKRLSRTEKMAFLDSNEPFDRLIHAAFFDPSEEE